VRGVGLGKMLVLIGGYVAECTSYTARSGQGARIGSFRNAIDASRPGQLFQREDQFAAVLLREENSVSKNLLQVTHGMFLGVREALNKSDFVAILRCSQKISPYISFICGVDIFCSRLVSLRTRTYSELP
jgi:hypothetical protein